jgi:prepilin-type N-terminal cleavage/methylation domain-containing protein
MNRAFTLIELLVVITIIVVLLALLMPAMDRAIYQTELVVCATRQRAVSTSIIAYAFDHRRFYPYRGRVNELGDGAGAYVTPMNLVTQLFNYDLRPPLKGYVKINDWLQCPFNQPVEMEQEGVEMTNKVVEASYMMMWGWQYQMEGRPDKGMFKLGDRFTANGDRWAVEGRKYSLLIGDMDLLYPNLAQASHPDRDPGTMAPYIWEEEVFVGVQWNLSRWSVDRRIRGPLDTNYAYDDNSVVRMTGVIGWGNPASSAEASLIDERMDRIPLAYDGVQLNNLNHRFQVPRQ